MSDDENLFSRWSSRKRAVAKEEAETVAVPAPSEDGPAVSVSEPDAPEAEETEEEILARFGLPSPESLGPGDDYTGFMQTGVPEFLRRRALRRLWRSNPVLANVDGLNDYDEDFTSPEETMKVLKTAYKVGRGFLRDEEETAKDVPEAEDALEGDSAAEDTTEVALASIEDVELPRAAPDEILDPVQESDGELSNTAEEAEKPRPRPKRMRFDT